ncbi:hypothetical protein BT69DRAFT_513390 [Atractiella rhizophila]|nr:hypothetical protein BT69DRAFT_513390 [Atractiella rhizophila]
MWIWRRRGRICWVSARRRRRGIARSWCLRLGIRVRVRAMGLGRRRRRGRRVWRTIRPISSPRLGSLVLPPLKNQSLASVIGKRRRRRRRRRVDGRNCRFMLNRNRRRHPTPLGSDLDRYREGEGDTELKELSEWKSGDGFELKKEGESFYSDGLKSASKEKAGKGKGKHKMTLREQENVIDSVKKENFNLKLKIFFLEDRLAKLAPDQIDAALKENIELKIEFQAARTEMKKYKRLLLEAQGALETLQKQQKIGEGGGEVEEGLWAGEGDEGSFGGAGEGDEEGGKDE